MHSIESRCATEPENVLFTGACVRLSAGNLHAGPVKGLNSLTTGAFAYIYVLLLFHTTSGGRGGGGAPKSKCTERGERERDRDRDRETEMCVMIETDRRKKKKKKKKHEYCSFKSLKGIKIVPSPRTSGLAEVMRSSFRRHTIPHRIQKSQH